MFLFPVNANPTPVDHVIRLCFFKIFLLIIGQGADHSFTLAGGIFKFYATKFHLFPIICFGAFKKSIKNCRVPCLGFDLSIFVKRFKIFLVTQLLLGAVKGLNIILRLFFLLKYNIF
jgi:hypothetical protein